jgi:hypothetical protein
LTLSELDRTEAFNTSLKAIKIVSKNVIYFLHRKGTVIFVLQWDTIPLIYFQSTLPWVEYMTYTNRPQFSGTAVWTLADTLVVLNHFDCFIAYFHFLNA